VSAGVQETDFVLVLVRDLARAQEFYGGTLGLERSSSSGERWVEYETGNLTLSLTQPETIGQEFQPTPGIALRVADVDEARERLAAKGIEFPVGTIDSGVCHMAPFTDPDGNGLLLHRRYAPRG
jgi:catechol 2,3-dioxygenase-like lactoylglutathione lyase family enzyme